MRVKNKDFWRKTAKWSAVGLVSALAVAFFIGMIILGGYERRASVYNLNRIGEVREQSSIYDANGDLHGTFGDENRVVVPLSAVSKSFIDALLAREDRRFWNHHGVDYHGILRAVVANAMAGKTKQGASTITQQLARNAYALEGRTLDRKLLEAALARRIEKRYSKEEILELYVNRIYFGAGFHGIEAASLGYFGKHAKDLSVGESAVLAGLIRSPSKLAPTRDAEAARTERDAVIDKMVENKALSAEEAASAKATLIDLGSAQKRAAHDSITDAVMEELEATLSPEILEAGGLKIYTTVDPRFQQLAESAVDRNLTAFENKKGYDHPRKTDFIPAPEGKPEKKTDYLQGALVAIDNKTGAILAAAGARDYSHSKFSRALASKRPLGSTFKPFVYAAAFDHGLLPGTLVDDSRIEKGEIRNVSKDWSPDNSDGDYLGPQPAALGLLKSRNTMTVRVGELAGLSQVREMGRRMHLNDNIPDYPVVFLGAFESSLKDLTAAYTVFPNLGAMPTPHLISKVVDTKGRTLMSAPTEKRQILDPGSAWMVSSILQEVMKSGTASKSAKLGWEKPSGGKTGTTNDYFDAWFVGYTSSITCGVWVGFDQPQTIGEKAYGSAMALPIWVDFMKSVPENQFPAQPLQNRPDLTEVKLCKVSGLKANASCEEQGLAYESQVPASSVPSKTCETHVPATPRVAYSDTVPPAASPPTGPAPATPLPLAETVPAPPAVQPLHSVVPPAGSKVPPASAAIASRPAAAQSPDSSLPYRPARVQPPAAQPTPYQVQRVDEPDAAPATFQRPPARVMRVPRPTSAAPTIAADDSHTVEPPAPSSDRQIRRNSRELYEVNGTIYERPAAAQEIPVAAPVAEPVAEPAPVKKAERPKSKRHLIFNDSEDDDDKPSPLPTQKIAAEPAALPAQANAPSPASPTTNGEQPVTTVEKRGNQTITTTVYPVRRAEAAKPAAEDNDND